MNFARQTFTLFLALLSFGCGGLHFSAIGQNSVSLDYVGSTPANALARAFVGGLPTNAPCHCITWQLTLLPNQAGRLPGTFELEASYSLPGRTDPNQMEPGPTVKLQGTWEILRGTKIDSNAVVYRLSREKPDYSLSFVKIGDNFLHLLESDKSLAVGDPGWSYTLNKKGVGMDR